MRMARRGWFLFAWILLFTRPAWAEVPSQFIAKLYSEVLGRAPDGGGWQAQTNYFLSSGCSQATLSAFASNILGSTEYTGKGYTPEEAVLTVYRAVLSREPDSTGFNHYVGLIRNSGWTAAQVARDQMVASEFVALVGAICSGGAYRQDWNGRQALDIGSGTWSQAQLQSCINNNTVCSVPPRVVVYLGSALTLPAGHVLETSGQPHRTLYARQARLVRNSGNFGHLLEMGPGATVRNIWVGGQRHLYKNVPTADGVRANFFYNGGTGGAIRNVRSDFPYQRTHVEASSAAGSLTVDGGLFVNYTAHHTNDGTWTWVSDGISNHNPNGTITNNHIIDPTDVGIVIFGHTGMVQASTASSNTVVHAGLSAYGSLVFDTIVCAGCGFTGPGIHDNQILAGRTAHSDIMLSVGTGPWFTPNCPSGQGCGSGARMNNNTTLWGDANQRTRVQHALVVDGMLNADTQGNLLSVSPEPLGACYHGAGIRNDSPGHASGSLMLESTGSVHSCISH
jgi:hypothetical protein